MTLLSLAVLGLFGCASECIDKELCDQVPPIPWDPGDGLSDGDDYGSGGSGGQAGTGGGSGTGGGTGTGTGGPVETIPDREIVSVRSCDVVVRHKKDGVSQVQIAGDFNGWVPADLGAPDTDGFREVDLGALAPGSYAFKYVYDGLFEGQPPINVYTQWSGGVENRSLRVGDCNLPLLQTVRASADAGGRLQATVQFASAADASPLDPAALTVTVGDQLVTPTVDIETGEIVVDVTGLPTGKHSLRVWAADEAGRHAENEPLFVPLWVEDTPFDWQDGILYFAFTDRFGNGDAGNEPMGPVGGVNEAANYQGGDFLGVIDALNSGYLRDLGVKTIWLSPVYENPEGGYAGNDGNQYTGYHGYWPVDPIAIETRFGDRDMSSSDRLDELVALAHAQGIRVLFDLVLNHVHEDHIYIDEHPEWFGPGCVCGAPGCGWDDKPVECWFTDYLPDLNYQQHDLTLRVIDDTLRLIELHDIDALRIDAAKHMDHVIMRSLSMRVRDTYEAGGGAPFYLVGETYTFTDGHGLIMNYVNDSELDGQFDFPLYYAIREAFAWGGSFRALSGMVDTSRSAYGSHYHLMSPFLGNHDVERFASAVTGVVGDFWNGQLLDPMAEGGQTVTQWDLIHRMTLGLAFTLTQPGVPLLYYGDEIGLHGGGDPDNRRFMMFDPGLSANQRTLLERVQAIGQARTASDALQHGAYRELWVDDDLYVYARDNGGGDVAIVALNKGGARTQGVDVSGLGIDGATFDDATQGRSFTVSGTTLSLSLDSWDHAVLVRP